MNFITKSWKFEYPNFNVQIIFLIFSLIQVIYGHPASRLIRNFHPLDTHSFNAIGTRLIGRNISLNFTLIYGSVQSMARYSIFKSLAFSKKIKIIIFESFC